MEAFFELFFFILKILGDGLGLILQLTITLGEMAAAPLKFVFSNAYRRRVLKDWDGNRARCLGDLVGGALVLLVVALLVCWWARLFL